MSIAIYRQTIQNYQMTGKAKISLKKKEIKKNKTVESKIKIKKIIGIK